MPLGSFWYAANKAFTPAQREDFLLWRAAVLELADMVLDAARAVSVRDGGGPRADELLSRVNGLFEVVSEIPLMADDPAPPTFKALAILEPRLLELVAEAKSHHKAKSATFCANAVWYGYPDTAFEGRGLKARISRLVGDYRSPGHPVLSSPDAYDVAMQALYKALPDCGKKCRCSIIAVAAMMR